MCTVFIQLFPLYCHGSNLSIGALNVKDTAMHAGYIHAVGQISVWPVLHKVAPSPMIRVV